MTDTKQNEPSLTREALRHTDATAEICPTLDRDYTHRVSAAVQAEDWQAARNLALSLHPADAADLFEFLERDEREKLVTAIGAELTGDILTELEPGVRDHILTILQPREVAKMIADLETGDAVYLLENLPPLKLQAILSQVSGLHRIAVEQAFQYPEDSAARIMRRDFITLPGFWTVAQTVEFCMQSEDLPEKFYHIYVADPAYRPIGSVALPDLLRAKGSVKLEDLADRDFDKLPPEAPQGEIVYMFEHYRINSAAVVGPGGRIIGVILVDDAVELIQDEAEEDIKQLAGVGGEDINDSVARVVRNRGYWLAVNLITAILAAVIISLFGTTIEKYVVLAAMGPLVASMGGNAGSQGLTLAVRALATKNLTDTNMRRVIVKELHIGAINGFIFAVIAGLLALAGAKAGLWDYDAKLFLVISAAMFLEFIAASASGVLVPLGLQAFKIDPAVSAVVFVTTVTDVVGFLSVLGLSAWLLS